MKAWSHFHGVVNDSALNSLGHRSRK